MQYLLTQTEYDHLASRPDITERELRVVIQNLCTQVADHKPVVWGWGPPEPRPWGCIRTAKKSWYCDKCPVQEVCPYEHKEWSK